MVEEIIEVSVTEFLTKTVSASQNIGIHC